MIRKYNIPEHIDQIQIYQYLRILICARFQKRIYYRSGFLFLPLEISLPSNDQTGKYQDAGTGGNDRI